MEVLQCRETKYRQLAVWLNLSIKKYFLHQTVASWFLNSEDQSVV